MDMAYDLNTGVISRVITDLWNFVSGGSGEDEHEPAVKNIVIEPGQAEDLMISETEMRVEIRAAFNQKLCIQRYEKNDRKVILYIPENWSKAVTVKTKRADIYCFLPNPCGCLKLHAEEGHILCRKEGNVCGIC